MATEAARMAAEAKSAGVVIAASEKLELPMNGPYPTLLAAVGSTNSIWSKSTEQNGLRQESVSSSLLGITGSSELHEVDSKQSVMSSSSESGFSDDTDSELELSTKSCSSSSAVFALQSPTATEKCSNRLRQRRNSDSQLMWSSEKSDGRKNSKSSAALVDGCKSIGILVHGCHLSADNWTRIVWGQPPNELGRLPHAVLLAWKKQAKVVVFGTGASEMDGLKECEYTLKYLWDRWSDLSQFEQLKDVPLGQAMKLMRAVSVLDTETQNTDQEVTAALRVFDSQACEQAFLVSSPTHLPRCLACACKVVEQDPTLFKGGIFASPCDTCYDGCSSQDVVVVEPPHRGDRDKTLDDFQFHELVRRSFRVPAAKKRWFLEQIEQLLQECGV